LADAPLIQTNRHLSLNVATQLGLKSHVRLVSSDDSYPNRYYYLTSVLVQIGNQVREIVAAVTFENSVSFPVLFGIHNMMNFDMTIDFRNHSYQVCEETTLEDNLVARINNMEYLLNVTHLTKEDLQPVESLPLPDLAMEAIIKEAVANKSLWSSLSYDLYFPIVSALNVTFSETSDDDDDL
jgi:hypothetical protein